MEKKKIYLVLTLVFIVLFIAVCLIDLFLENLEKKQELLLKVLEIISASSISFTLSCTISIKKVTVIIRQRLNQKTLMVFWLHKITAITILLI